MSTKISDSELIRKYALIHLSRYIEGIRSTDLRIETEDSLGHTIPPDEYNKGKYRSAIWNLDKLYPHWVVKESKGRKEVYFYPTQQLLDEIMFIEIPEDEINQFANYWNEKLLEVNRFEEVIEESLDELEAFEIDKMNEDEIMQLNERLNDVRKTLEKYHDTLSAILRK